MNVTNGDDTTIDAKQIGYISDDVANLFSLLAAIIHRKLPDVPEKEKIRFLQSRKSEPFSSIKKRDLITFNQVYFLRNLLKCLIALDETNATETEGHMIDIGSGVGTASIAWLQMSELRGAKGISISCFDRSEYQLGLCEDVLRSLADENAILEFQSAFKSSYTKRQTSIFSYSLCEMIFEKFPKHQILNMLSDNNLIVDYNENIFPFMSDHHKIFKSVLVKSKVYILSTSMSILLGRKSLHLSYAHAKK